MIDKKDLIDIYKNYNNIGVIHSMPGYKYKYVECLCGYKKHIKNNEELYYCPNCKSRIYNYSELTFGEKSFNVNSAEAFPLNEKDFYRFGIVISNKKVKYRINFSKKTLKDLKCESESFLLFFDGFETNKDNMIRYINLNTEEEVKKKDFLDFMDGRCVYLCCNRYNKYKKFEDETYSYIGTAIYNVLNSMAKDFSSNPYYEILVKAGIDPYEVSTGFHVNINKNGKSPSEILGIKKYSLNKLKEYKDKYIPIKEIEDKFGSKMVQYYDIFVNNLNWGERALERAAVDKISYIVKNANISLQKLIAYLNDCYVKQHMYDYNELELLSLYYDSLIMAEQLELPFDKAPRSLKRYHDVLVKESKLVEDKIKSMKLSSEMIQYEPFETIAVKDEEGKYNQDYSIILPKSISDVINEGKTMHHCVGSYVDRIIQKKSVIYFLRKAGDLEGRSVATFEVNPLSDSIVQIQAPYNKKPDEKAINFIKKWCKKHKIECSRY